MMENESEGEAEISSRVLCRDKRAYATGRAARTSDVPEVGAVSFAALVVSGSFFFSGLGDFFFSATAAWGFKPSVAAAVAVVPLPVAADASRAAALLASLGTAARIAATHASASCV